MDRRTSNRDRKEQPSSISSGKRTYEPLENRWSSLPMDTYNPREITSALSASWVRMRYLMERVWGVGCWWGSRMMEERVSKELSPTGQNTTKDIYISRECAPSNTAVVYELPVYHSQTDDFSDLSQPTLEAPAAAQKKKNSDRKHVMNTMKH